MAFPPYSRSIPESKNIVLPDISIIIPHLNDEKRLARCLASLEAQTHSAERIEVIVVDNGSHELPCATVGQFPSVRLAEEKSRGPGPARNMGVSLARAPILAFTDSDCLAEPSWVAAILACFRTDPDLQIIGGEVQVFPEITAQPSSVEAYEMLYAFRQKWQIRRLGFSVTANLAMHRSVFSAVGPFAGIETAEDLEWGQRAARLGHATVYAAEVVVRHPARASMEALRLQWDRHTSHHFHRRAEGFYGRMKWVLRAAAMAASPLVELPYLLRTKKIAGRSERLQAFQTLVAVRLYRTRRMLLSVLDPETRTAPAKWNRTRRIESDPQE